MDETEFEVTILEPCMIKGEHKAVGEFVTIDADDARYLAQCGRVKIGRHKLGDQAKAAKAA